MILLNQEKTYNLKGKSSKCVRTAVIGDVHLGHSRTITPEIVEKVFLYLIDSHHLPTLDMLVLNGDVFDRLLQRNDPHSLHLDTFVVRTLQMCEKHKVALRVLAGTHSHDMDQTKVFKDMYEILGMSFDFQYYDDIVVEIHQKTGLRMVFVPDNWDPLPENTYAAVVRRMAEKGLTQVDVAYLHGAFEWQYPPQVTEPTHSTAAWSKLVKYGIFVNHVHQHRVNGVIVAPGSFDRLCHGDEGSKGYVISQIDSEGLHYEFIENKKAKLMIDIDCRDTEVEQAISKIEDSIAKLPKGSFVRILANEADNISKAKDYFRVTYPYLHWDDKIYRDEKETVDSLVPEEIYVPPALNKTVLPGILERRMLSKQIPRETVKTAMRLMLEHA